MRIRCWVRAISSRCTELTSSSCSRPRSRSRRADRRAAPASRPLPGLLDGGAGLGGQVRRRPRAGPARRPRATPTASAARPSRSSRSRRSAARARASRSALGGAQQRVGPAVQRPGPLLGGAQRQPGVHLGLPGGAGRLGEPLALGGVGLLVGGVLGGGQPRLEVGQPGEVAVAGLLGLGDRLGRAARPRPGRRGPGSRTDRAPRRPRPAWRRTRAAWPGRRRPASGPRAARPRGRDMSKPSRSEAATACGELLGGLVDGGLDLDQAGLAATSRRRRSGRRAGRPRGSPR